jgi:AcrR family transcriptional regulator
VYHHFADKRALFEVVFEAVEEDLIASVGSIVQPAGAFNQLRGSLLAFLHASRIARLKPGRPEIGYPHAPGDRWDTPKRAQLQLQ